jgi:predicted dehydrogenase
MIIGILGLGSIGLRHARNALSLGVEVCGFDPDVERKAIFEGIGGKFCESEKGLLEKCDAIVIATPNRFHRQNLFDIADHGCHVLAEKPLAHTSSGLDNILRDMQEKKKFFAVAMNLRFNPVIQAAHDILSQKTYGPVLWARFICSSYLPDWRPHQDYRTGYTVDARYGGVIFDIVHEIDLAYHLLGSANVHSCVAWQSGVLETQAEDCAEIVLAHGNGAYSSIHLDYVSPNKRREFEIQMKNGLLTGDLIRRRLCIQDQKGRIVLDKNFSGTADEDYIEEMKRFIAAVQGKNSFPCDGAEALRVLELTIQARRIAGLPEEEAA